MAFTTISNIITPEVLADQISAKFPDQLVFGNSNLVEIDSTFPLGSPGTKFKIPFWKRIAAFGALTEGTAMTPTNITTGSEYAVVQRAGLALEVYDTADLVSKADPVGEISDQIGRRAAEFIDNALVVEANKTPNVFDQTGASATNSTKTLDQNAIILGMLQLGDNQAKLRTGGAIIMHSKVFADLLQTAAIQNQYQSGGNVILGGSLPTILGLPIIVSDLVYTAPISSGSTITKYDTYIIAPGALALFYQRQVMVEFDRDILLSADVISSNVHFAPHLYGWDDDGNAKAAEDNKSIHAVIIQSK